MRTRISVSICVAMLGFAVSHSPVLAQQKTVKACQEEWRANKADNQAKGITERAYVAQCRVGVPSAQPSSTPPATPAPPTSAATPTPTKTVKACQDEWRANKSAYQAARITEKAYVEKCRIGETVALPATPTTAAPPPAPRRATPAPAPTAAPPPAAQTTAPAPAPAPPASASVKPSPNVPTSPATGAGQFQTEAQAKSQCPADVVVWVNLPSKVYHFAGYRSYGTTKSGAYMCEAQATAQGFRASKTEKRPSA
jgi:hypothetical protein